MPENLAAKRRNRNILVGVLALLVGIGGGVAIWSITSDDASSETAGEIILSPAADVGADPFSAEPFAAPPDPALAQQATPVSAPITVAPGQTVTATPGGKEGLYGGTKDKAACDPQKMVDFLAANPEKAAAWVAALKADPNVKLPNGDPLTVATIPDYVASLTPLVLLEDTRVTNHGYKDGKPTKLQAVLQKGMAVLVDGNGVPRTKCYCGNPLLPPVASKSAPTYTGSKWPDFDPAKIGVVDRNPTVITTFVVTDLATGKTFTLKAGSKIVPPTGSTAPRSTTTAAPTTTAANATTTTAASTSTAPAGPTTTAPAPATTTTAAPGGPPPVLAKLNVSRDAANDSFCTSQFGPGNVGWNFFTSFTDADADGNGTVRVNGIDEQASTTFSGDGSKGGWTVRYCSKSGKTFKIEQVDRAGNVSDPQSVTTP